MSESQTLHFRKSLEAPGYHELVSPRSAPLQHITLGIQRLRGDETHSFAASDIETVVVLLNGRISVSGPAIGKPITLARRSVFKDPASAIYIAAGDQLKISALQDAEIALAQAPSAPKQSKTQVVLPANLQPRDVGKGNWSRIVCDIIPGEFEAEKLIIGETFNPPGNWSSSPPHKHDRHNPPHESQFEEVYFYRLQPTRGFALQRIYTAEGDLDQCYAVKHNDVVVLPRGYHPVAAAPGYRLYYLWILAGQSRDPVWFEDPEHRWIRGPSEAPARSREETE